MSMKIDQIETVIKAMANADSYHDSVKCLYSRIAASLSTLMSNAVGSTVDDEEILKDIEQELIHLVSFIDKRNRTEADLLCILFGKKQAIRRANQYRFDHDYDYGNRLLDGTIESDQEWEDKDRELGTLTDTRAHYLRR